jgi:hypothetical protein
MAIHFPTPPRSLSRRDLLLQLGSGFGMLGLANLAAGASMGPFDPKPPHFTPRVKNVIFLFMNGGWSQVDTFDPKPALTKRDGQPMPGGTPKTDADDGKVGNLMKSPFSFSRYGQSGIEVSELFPQVGGLIDDFCVIRSMHTDVPNHEPGLFMMNCGAIQPGRPSMGSWITYGLGTENRNLPGFVVLCPGVPTVGPPLWESAFLPAVYQGTHIRTEETDPKKLIRYIQNKRFGHDVQRRQIDLLARLNRKHLQTREGDSQLEAAIEATETAFRMQTEAPEVFDITKEPDATRANYGDSDFGRGCLMARRMVEKGVRMVQVYFGKVQPWDSHGDIMAHKRLAAEADPAIASLVRDLKARGLFDETLVIVGSEFGRTPAVQIQPTSQLHNGRDHNSLGFTVLLAGGGVKGGMTYGATDDFGYTAVDKPVHVHDLHATILHLLGLDHTKLTFHYSGRDFRLTDVHGNVVKPILT